MTTATQHNTARVESKQAFSEAISKGRLSLLWTDNNYAGSYMYMGKIAGRSMFKNIETREYDV